MRPILSHHVASAYLARLVSDARGFSVGSPGEFGRGQVRVGTYKSKKKVQTRDGEERTVYVYSDRQIQHRHREKASRLEQLRGKMEDLRAQARKDLRGEDAEDRAVALAVLLMDATYERVGNEESAGEGHFGVSGWEVRHVHFGKDKATISYVGKSGVSHEKVVEDGGILKALKSAVKGKKKGDCVVDVGAATINAYLKDFDITSKDIRGFHANELMKEMLQKVRSKGKPLPKGRKEKDAVLKDEFKEALEEVAKEVGHEPATLRNQYLVPALKDAFLHDGTVVDHLDGDD